MNYENKPFSGYDSGADAWRDNAVSYGIDEAIIITRNYLDMNLKREHSDDERQHCRELFAAMYETTADRIAPTASARTLKRRQQNICHKISVVLAPSSFASQTHFCRKLHKDIQGNSSDY